jgi:hypothetical protein
MEMILQSSDNSLTKVSRFDFVLATSTKFELVFENNLAHSAPIPSDAPVIRIVFVSEL